MQPYPYQTKQIDLTAERFAAGDLRVLDQLATGGGKTVEFACISNRYINKNTDSVLILVHREELMQQAYNTLYEWFGIIAERITADNKKPQTARVYIAMVETANNRLKKDKNYFCNVGLLIIDECHLGNFTKLLDYFPTTKTIGYTATAIASKKKFPLNKIYQSIVCGPQIEELIAMGSLCQNVTYNVKNVSRDELHIVRGEFDQHEMAEVYGKSKHIENTILGYEKHALHKKTIVFNCNVHHSKLVNDAFRSHGYNARHLDGTETKAVRKEVLEWFKNTPGAILNNVGIATTGFDEPSIEAVIVNKDTLSLALWLQMTGRGGRKFEGKKYFIIIDMGTNAKVHLDWCDFRDWEDIFNYPDKPRENTGGVGAVKECISCEALIPASAGVCRYCAAEQPAPVVTYDGLLVEFELVTKKIDVARLIDQNKSKNPYYTLNQILREMIQKARTELKGELSDSTAYRLLESYQDKVQEWCKASGKNYNSWHKLTTGKWFNDELLKVFNWKAPEFSVAI